MDTPFKNRKEAGVLLARRLMGYAGRTDVIVLALPRGGVPVGFQIAAALNVPLDVVLVRKLGMPGHAECAIGAISNDQSELQTEVVAAYGIPTKEIEAIASRERRELMRRDALYRAGRPPLRLCGKTVILVDDGLATGSTMRVAVRTVRMAKPAKIVVAVPVSAAQPHEELALEADEMICLSTPAPFYGVGQRYLDFEQTTDDEVISLLQEAARTHPLSAWIASPAPSHG